MGLQKVRLECKKATPSKTNLAGNSSNTFRTTKEEKVVDIVVVDPEIMYWQNFCMQQDLSFTLPNALEKSKNATAIDIPRLKLLLSHDQFGSIDLELHMI